MLLGRNPNDRDNFVWICMKIGSTGADVAAGDLVLSFAAADGEGWWGRRGWVDFTRYWCWAWSDNSVASKYSVPTMSDMELSDQRTKRALDSFLPARYIQFGFAFGINRNTQTQTNVRFVSSLA